MNLSRKILVGALIASLPMGGALACTTAAWSSVTGAPVANDPAPGDGIVVSRYSGSCGLRTAAGGSSFVVSDHPVAATDTTYRARFYVLTTPTADATVFQAYSDAGATTPVITVQYQPGAGAFAVTIPGSTVASVTGIEANRWYGVEVLRQVGAPARVLVQGGGGLGFDPVDARNEQNITKIVADVAGVGNATGAGVETARLGAIGATTGSVGVEEFDSSRGTSLIGFLLRGDANSSGARDTGDIIAIAREALIPLSFTGQPDCNESGGVETGDIICAARIAIGL